MSRNVLKTSLTTASFSIVFQVWKFSITFFELVFNFHLWNVYIIFKKVDVGLNCDFNHIIKIENRDIVSHCDTGWLYKRYNPTQMCNLFHLYYF